MFRGIEIAAKGMASISDLNDIIANNMANVSTPGFKQLIPTFKDIHELAVKDKELSGLEEDVHLGSLSMGSMLDITQLDFRQGALLKTDGTLDVALNSDGFFVVKSDTGEECYTRNGGFFINEDGNLVTRAGDVVLGENGGSIDLDLGANSISDIVIMGDGRIMVKEQEVDRLKVVGFEDSSSLKAMGNTLFRNIDKENKPLAIDNYMVTQGYLESSNANVIESMINSITGTRTYETLSKVVRSADLTMKKAVNDVGRVIR